MARPAFDGEAVRAIREASRTPTPDRLHALKAKVAGAEKLPAHEVERLAGDARRLAAEAQDLAGTFSVIAHELRTGDPF